MNTLLTGGIVAAIIAAWSQVKAFASYLSSFVVIQASLDDSTSTHIRRHLRADWKLLPSGQLVYKIKYVTFTGRTDSTPVPFKVPSQNAIYYKSGRVIFVSDNGSEMKFSYLRGTVDLEGIIMKVLFDFEIYLKRPDIVSRYRLVKHVGRDKTMWGSSSGENVGIRDSPTSLRESSVDIQVDVSRDKSFMYDSALWQDNDKKVNPFDGLYYAPEVMNYVDQARMWMNRKSWYIDRNIPWRRGWLLHSRRGGTGKSSFARAVAQDLGIPINQFYLSTLSDQEFMDKWDGMDVPCVVLLEDLDNVFNGREPVGKTTLTFDCLLNQISGVSAAYGIFLIVTTNCIEKIDPALGVEFSGGISTRPGRIDSVIEFGDITPEGRKQMAQRILRDWPDLVAKASVIGGLTPIQFQETCIQMAQERLKILEQHNTPESQRLRQQIIDEATESFKYG